MTKYEILAVDREERECPDVKADTFLILGPWGIEVMRAGTRKRAQTWIAHPNGDADA